MHITLLRKIGIEEQQHLVNQITFLHFFFLVAIYFILKQPFQLCFVFLFRKHLRLFNENAKVRQSVEHPENGFGCG